MTQGFAAAFAKSSSSARPTLLTRLRGHHRAAPPAAAHQSRHPVAQSQAMQLSRHQQARAPLPHEPSPGVEEANQDYTTYAALPPPPGGPAPYLRAPAPLLWRDDVEHLPPPPPAPCPATSRPWQARQPCTLAPFVKAAPLPCPPYCDQDGARAQHASQAWYVVEANDWVPASHLLVLGMVEHFLDDAMRFHSAKAWPRSPFPGTGLRQPRVALPGMRDPAIQP